MKKTIKFKTSRQVERMLGETFEEFIEERRVMNLSKSTIKNYNASFKIFCDYHEINPSDFPLNDIKIQLFYKFINHMKNNEIRPQTINHHLTNWKAFLNWANLNEKMEEPVKIRKIEVQEDLPKMYENEEIEKMLEKPRPGDGFVTWRTWAVISTVYATGLRASTICSLKLESLNFQLGEIAIEKQKNKHAGILPLTPALTNCLKEYMKKWLFECKPTDWLFPTNAGDQLTPDVLSKSINKYCENLGFKGHGIHSIRHNFSRDMILNGAGEYRLQKYLQHSSISMSQHYVKLFASDLKKDAEDYSPLDNAKKKAKRTSQFKKS